MFCVVTHPSAAAPGLLFLKTSPVLVLGKQVYRCLPDILSRLAEHELNRLRGHVDACGLIYFPLVSYEQEFVSIFYALEATFTSEG